MFFNVGSSHENGIRKEIKKEKRIQEKLSIAVYCHVMSNNVSAIWQRFSNILATFAGFPPIIPTGFYCAQRLHQTLRMLRT